MNNAVSHSWISLFSVFQMILFQINLSAEFVNCPGILLASCLTGLFFCSPCSGFRETMENVRKRVDVRLFRSDEEERILRRIARPTFVRQEIFYEHLVAIQNRKERVLLNKPIYVGMSVLDLSKHLIFYFYYILFIHKQKSKWKNANIMDEFK